MEKNQNNKKNTDTYIHVVVVETARIMFKSCNNLQWKRIKQTNKKNIDIYINVVV